MRKFRIGALGLILTGVVAGVSGALLAQTAMKPGHERVPPFREPSPYMSQADIQAGLSKLDPKLVASRTGGAIDFAKDKAPGVVRRRMRGPQYAITHTRTVEYMIVTKGTATSSPAVRSSRQPSTAIPIRIPTRMRRFAARSASRAGSRARLALGTCSSISRVHRTGSATSTTRSNISRSRFPTWIPPLASKGRKWREIEEIRN